MPYNAALRIMTLQCGSAENSFPSARKRWFTLGIGATSGNCQNKEQRWFTKRLHHHPTRSGNDGTSLNTILPTDIFAFIPMCVYHVPIFFMYIFILQMCLYVHIQYECICFKRILLNASLCTQHTAQRGQTSQNVRVWQRERLIAGPCKVACVPQTPNSSEGFSRTLLKARWGRGVVSSCKLLGVGILCDCSCPHASGHFL